MVDISITELREMSVGSLEMVKRRIDEELQRRREIERIKLIENFKEAFKALRDADVAIQYSDEYGEDSTLLYEWDGFYFE